MGILKLGSRGSEVKNLQIQLNSIGYSLAADGIFGKGTENAVKQVQAGAGLAVDGLVGPKTIYAINNSGEAHADHLTESDLISAAKSLGVELAAMKAVNQVESRGTGFTANGNLKVLFERHKMYKYIKQKYGQVRADQLQSQYPDIVNSSAGGYKGNDAENERLSRAVSIDEECAYNSASYGLFQIMGFNYSYCGYSNAKQMYLDMLTGEGAHLRAFVGFIKADQNLWNSLKQKNWPRFAKLYNGPGYEANKYDVKLETAYKSFL